MTASFPGTVKVFTTHVNITESIDASHPNDIQAEVVAIETNLGVNPHVSTSPAPSGLFNAVAATYSSVSARIANVEQGVVSDAHTQYVHLKGGDTIVSSGSGVVGLAIKSADSPTVDAFQVTDSASTKKLWLDNSFRLNVAGGLTVNAGGANVSGDASVGGAVNAQRAALTQTTATQVGLTIRQAASATADALQVQDSAGNVLFRIGKTGKVSAQLSQSFYVGGAFVFGPKPGRWIIPAACILQVGYARLDGGTTGASVQWGLYVNGAQAVTGGTSNLSSAVTQGSGVSTYNFSTVSLSAGDSVQLFIGAITGTAADFSVTVGGSWLAS